MSTVVFAGPYEIKKNNVRKTYAIMEDWSISARTYKDGSLIK